MDDLNKRIAARPAAKVTPERIKAVQACVQYTVIGVLTICVITLVNGFTVTGESACASPENYDKVIGEEIAYKQAESKIWMLEGYLLKQSLYEGGEGMLKKSDAASVLGASVGTAGNGDDNYIRQIALGAAIQICGQSAAEHVVATATEFVTFINGK